MYLQAQLKTKLEVFCEEVTFRLKGILYTGYSKDDEVMYKLE